MGPLAIFFWYNKKKALMRWCAHFYGFATFEKNETKVTEFREQFSSQI